MCILRFDWLIALYLFMSLVRNASFPIVKTVVSGKKSVISTNHCAKTFCWWVFGCAPHLLVRAPPQLTRFTSPTTPSTPRHMRGRQFPTLEIWQSPGKFTGKRITQIYVYVCIYMRLLFRSARLGWRRPPSRTNSSVPKKTRMPVGQPIRIRSRDRPRWQYPFEGGRYCCR